MIKLDQPTQLNVVYLTNGCCENTGHVDAKKLHDLGLDFGVYVNSGSDIITTRKIPADSDFFPLNADENKFIFEDCMEVGLGEVQFGYSVLAYGRKWLC